MDMGLEIREGGSQSVSLPPFIFPEVPSNDTLSTFPLEAVDIDRWGRRRRHSESLACIRMSGIITAESSSPVGRRSVRVRGRDHTAAAAEVVMQTPKVAIQLQKFQLENPLGSIILYRHKCKLMICSTLNPPEKFLEFPL